jgi:hypothetical protein
MVAVLDKHGHPLMPCHPARARKLLDTGRAVVARRTPFVIRLKDRTVAGSEVAGVGRGCYARTRTDKYGFPRLYLPRLKEHHGFVTGDLVRATIPRGKYFGTHTGRVAVRGSGQFNIRTGQGLLQGIHHRYVSRLQRSDGYGYTVEHEKAQD